MTLNTETRSIVLSPDRRWLSLNFNGDSPQSFYALWLRDNCGCGNCRVALSAERKLFTGDLDKKLTITSAEQAENSTIWINYSDGHQSAFDPNWLIAQSQANNFRVSPKYWHQEAPPPKFDYSSVINDNDSCKAYLTALQEYGAALLENSPTEPDSTLEFAERFSIVRGTAFGKLHKVFNNPDGYNVAHTANALPPHSDLASYPVPPSGQILHYLLNEAEGGETILVDGWRVLDLLRRDHPEAFILLCETPVHHQIFSQDRDTQSYEPLITCYPNGEIKSFRFSNQTALPHRLSNDVMPQFYDAYMTLSRLIADKENQWHHRSASGDLICINNHRVQHGRQAYRPSTGARMLQDVYFEWDDMMAYARVLNGHIPKSAWPTWEPQAET